MSRSDLNAAPSSEIAAVLPQVTIGIQFPGSLSLAEKISLHQFADARVLSLQILLECLEARLCALGDGVTQFLVARRLVTDGALAVVRPETVGEFAKNSACHV